MVICDSPRLWLDNCAIVQDLLTINLNQVKNMQEKIKAWNHYHRRRLESRSLSWDKSLQEVSWIIVLVHLLQNSQLISYVTHPITFLLTCSSSW